MKTDTIQHYLSADGIRLTVADTTNASAHAEAIHHMPALSSVILAKMMTGAALLTNDFKNHEGVSFKWVTGSPAGEIHIDAYDSHYIRGYIECPDAGIARPVDAAHEADLVSEDGKLFVTRYSLLKMPYTSAVTLHKGDISACLTEYLNTSEQVLSAVSLTAKADEEGKILRSAGYAAQLLPDGNLAKFAELFRDLTKWDAAAEPGSVHSTEQLLADGHFELLEEFPVKFACTCGEERIRKTLLTLPESERAALLADPSIEIVCHYCGKKYTIEREVLNKWFTDAKGEEIQ